MSNRSVALHDPSPTPNGPNAVKDRLIVALDVSSAAEAQTLVSAIGESAHIYKVGKQLFTAEGPQVVRDLVASGRKVFLDLKFHDIPNTVAHAVAEAAKLKVSMLTVHASGGLKMLKAAAEAANSSASKPLILAVTVLTSLDRRRPHRNRILRKRRSRSPSTRWTGAYGRMRRHRQLGPRSRIAPP